MEYVKVNIEGFEFRFEKWPKAPSGAFDYSSRIIVCDAIKIGNITYKLVVYPFYDHTVKHYVDKIQGVAELISIDNDIEILNVPYSVSHKGRDYQVRIYHPFLPFKSLNSQKIKKVFFNANVNSFLQCTQAEILSGFNNIEHAETDWQSYHVFRLTNISYTEKELVRGENLYIPNKYITCAPRVNRSDEKEEYGIRLERDTYMGFFYKYDFKNLSVPPTFYLDYQDFYYLNKTERTNRKKETVKDRNVDCRLRRLIVRESPDENWKPLLGFKVLNTERWHEVFKETTLYVHKKHFQAAQAFFGHGIFKNICMFEDLPAELLCLTQPQGEDAIKPKQIKEKSEKTDKPTKKATAGNATKGISYKDYQIQIAENKSVSVLKKGQLCANTKAALREIAEKSGFKIEEKWTTQQLGAKLVAFLNS